MSGIDYIMNNIKEVFHDKLTVEDREPAFSYELFGYDFNLLLPKAAFYQQVLVLTGVQMFICCILSAIIYKFVALKPKTPTAFLVCHGIVIPLVFWIPFQIIEYFDVRSAAFRMLCIVTPMNFPFRCIEAFYGFTPKDAVGSMSNFIQHAGFHMIPLYCKKTGRMMKLTWKAELHTLKAYFGWYLLSAAAFSLVLPFVDTLTASLSRDPSEFFIAFDHRQLSNTYILGVLCNLSLCYGFHGYGAMAIPLSGAVYDMKLTDWPLFTATSPSDFWGRKWNNLIHYALKQGIYKPVRFITDSKELAIFSTFMVSGLMHEYIWMVIFYESNNQLKEGCIDCNGSYQFGKQVIFFTWNGACVFFQMCIGDKILQRSPRLKKIWYNHIPKPIITALVISLALPIAHFFTGDIHKTGYFKTMQTGMPIVTCSSSSSSNIIVDDSNLYTSDY